jgi:hypothetical protein
MWGISWLAVELLAAQEGFYPMKFLGSSFVADILPSRKRYIAYALFPK